MSSSTLKALSMILLLVAVALAVLAFSVSKRWVDQAKKTEQALRLEQAKQLQQPLALVALRALPAGEAIPADAVGLRPVSVQASGAFTNPLSAIGRQPLYWVETGSPISERLFTAPNPNLADAVPAGFRAVSVEINEIVAVGGYLKPGDTVDIWAYVRGDNPQALRLRSAVKVLAVEDKLLNQASPDNSAPRRIRTAVLELPEAVISAVLLAANQGELRLALRGKAVSLDSSSPAALTLDDWLGKKPKPISVPSKAPAPVASSIPKPVPETVEVFLGAQRAKP
jgi:pilus assembly protein CpaB